MRTRGWTLGWLVTLALLGSACGNPCDDLAKTICNCQPTNSAQTTCLNRVSSDNSPQPSSADLDTCQQLEKTCTCAALASGDLAACGLAKSPASPGTP
jgi:hypothetical protein